MNDRDRERRDAQLWRAQVARTRTAGQPRPYRAVLVDASGWQIPGTTTLVVLDLTPGAAAEESARTLDELLRSLLRMARSAPTWPARTAWTCASGAPPNRCSATR